jgi:hypothetical protein
MVLSIVGVFSRRRYSIATQFPTTTGLCRAVMLMAVVQLCWVEGAARAQPQSEYQDVHAVMNVRPHSNGTAPITIRDIFKEPFALNAAILLNAKLFATGTGQDLSGRSILYPSVTEEFFVLLAGEFDPDNQASLNAAIGRWTKLSAKFTEAEMAALNNSVPLDLSSVVITPFAEAILPFDPDGKKVLIARQWN